MVMLLMMMPLQHNNAFVMVTMLTRYDVVT
jgi:hypothetical protein